MPEVITVDRETAARINPLIGSSWTEDTLDNVANVLYEIGYMVAETDLAKGNVFRVFEVAAAALEWERTNISSAVQARKERGHD